MITRVKESILIDEIANQNIEIKAKLVKTSEKTVWRGAKCCKN